MNARRQPWERPEFQPSASGSGLLVPTPEREREVWTKDEQRLVTRATKMLAARGLKLTMTCTDPHCQHEPLKVAEVAGGLELRCRHKTRVMSHAS